MKNCKINPNFRINVKIILLALVIVLGAVNPVFGEEIKNYKQYRKETNFALYTANSWVFLRLDTRNGKIDAIVPANPKKGKVLNSKALVEDGKPGRFELFPTDNDWEWVVFDSDTGDSWRLKWNTKKDNLIKINIPSKD